MTLLEREPALEALEGVLGEVAHGEGRVALVYGEAGIGNPKVSCEGHTAGAATESSSAHGARH